MATFLSSVGSIIAIVEIALALCKYIHETKRQKRQDTIREFNLLLDHTYSLKEQYNTLFKEPLFEPPKIQSNIELHKATMILLTQWESFSRGVHDYIYDFRLFIYLTPKELSDMLDALTKFVGEERKSKMYDRLFADFTYLSHDVSNCMQMKLDNKRIPINYKTIRRLK